MCDTYLPIMGGLETYASNLAEKLVKKGYHVTILTQWLQESQKYEMKNGVEIIRVKIPGILFQNRTGINHLIKALIFLTIFYKKRNSVDIIHCFPLCEAGIMGSFLKILFKKPVVIREGSFSIDHLVNNAIFRILTKIPLKIADFIYVDHFSLKRNFGKISDRDILFIQNPVDIDTFRPGTKKITKFEDKFVILYLGRLPKYKGVEYLIKAMSKVTRTIPEAVLLIVGCGEQEDALQEEALKEMTRSTVTLDKKIYFMDAVPFENVPGIMKNADVFVHPSLGGETPNTVLEALSSGVPTICTNQIGSERILIDRMTVLKVNPKSSDEIADKIFEIYNNDDLRKRLQYNSRKIIEDNASWEKHLSVIRSIYEKNSVIPSSQLESVKGLLTDDNKEALVDELFGVRS